MSQVIQTEAFRDWLGGLKDRRAIARVLVRAERIARGNLGDVKSVGAGVSEARIDYGPGYRLYFASRRRNIDRAARRRRQEYARQGHQIGEGIVGGVEGRKRWVK